MSNEHFYRVSSCCNVQAVRITMSRSQSQVCTSAYVCKWIGSFFISPPLTALARACLSDCLLLRSRLRLIDLLVTSHQQISLKFTVPCFRLMLTNHEIRIHFITQTKMNLNAMPHDCAFLFTPVVFQVVCSSSRYSFIKLGSSNLSSTSEKYIEMIGILQRRGPNERKSDEKQASS